MTACTVYIELKYEGEDPVPLRRLHSVDASLDILAFITSLRDATIGDGMWEIEKIQILTADCLRCRAPDDHHASILEFLRTFGGAIFYPTERVKV